MTKAALMKHAFGSMARGLSLCALVTALVLPSDAGASETRGFVVSWFYPAMYATDADCPEGLNPKVEGLFERILKEEGKSPSEIAKLMENIPRNFDEIATNRGRINGKPVNVYLNPTSVPDPRIKIGQGKIGLGFNLDGKIGPSDFTDPETHEKGVDNQLSRILACFEATRGTPIRGLWPGMQWDAPRDTMPAWLIQISGIDDVKNDDDVSISFYRATAPILRNAKGDPQANMTFLVDTTPRYQNKVHGRIKDGMILSDVFEFFLAADPYIQPDFNFKKARVRLRIESNGTLNGYIGGYASVEGAYLGAAAGEAGEEAFSAVDVPGIYYALQRLADGDVDSKAGKRTTISATYRIDAVPAFFTTPKDKPEPQTASASPQ